MNDYIRLGGEKEMLSIEESADEIVEMLIAEDEEQENIEESGAGKK